MRFIEGMGGSARGSSSVEVEGIEAADGRASCVAGVCIWSVVVAGAEGCGCVV
jgi:hypothetical protein